MSKIDYCRLPSIPCSKRYNTSKSYFNNSDLNTCSLFNPDQVKKFFNQNSKNNINKYKVCYENYPTKGNPGDYFCELNEENKCVAKNIINCSSQKIQKKKNKEKNNFNLPNDSKCMPPNVKGCNIITNDKAKLYINGKPFYKCQNNNPEMCIDEVYSSNNFGYPISQSQSDPPNRKLLYTNEFNKQNNKTIISCPNNYEICKNHNNLCCKKENNKIVDKCIPPENNIFGSQYSNCNFENDNTNLFVNNSPALDKYKTEKQCLDWCANNPDCKITTKFLDRNGNLKCRYYQYSKNDNRIHIVDDDNTTMYDKNKHTYEPNPNKNILPKYDFASIPYDITKKERGNLINGCGPNGCCASGIKNAEKNAKNCLLKKESNLIGDPYKPYQYSSLGGKTKMGTINNLSGNAYINYN